MPKVKATRFECCQVFALSVCLVRAVVPEQDDPSMPVNTLRMWILGIVFTMIGSGINQFFFLRYSGVHIGCLVGELLAFPVGVLLAKIIPVGRFNPDRNFNIKEHAVVTIMYAHLQSPNWSLC